MEESKDQPGSAETNAPTGAATSGAEPTAIPVVEPAPSSQSGGAAPTSGRPPASGQAAASQPVNEVDSLRQEVQRIRDQLLRTAADFDNFRKRTRRDLADTERKGRDDAIRELLPVFDNLERAVTHADTATDVRSLVDGMKMVLRQLADALTRIGIERLESLGQPFDPLVHEAIQSFESADKPPGTVVFEHQAGYRAGDRLVRPASVVVAKAPAGAPVPEPDPAS